MEQQIQLTNNSNQKKIIILSVVALLMFAIGTYFGVECLTLINTPNVGLEGIALIVFIPLFIACALITTILNIIVIILSTKAIKNTDNKSISIIFLIINIITLIANIAMTICLWL